MPLIEHTLRMQMKNISEIEDFPLEKLTYEELQVFSSGHANTTTRQLRYHVDRKYRGKLFHQTLPFIVNKFPNLTSIEISSRHYKSSGSIKNAAFLDSMAPLNKFQKLKHLNFGWFTSEYLRDVMIPTLESFEFKTRFKETDETNFLTNFLVRHHQNLRHLSFDIDGSFSWISEIAIFSLNFISELKSLSIRKYRRSYDDSNNTAAKALILDCIREHAQQGLKFDLNLKDGKSESFMKRDDGHIIVRYDKKMKKWRLLGLS